VGLLLSHHFVRIAYEGAAAIRSSNPHVGIPALAALLNDTFAQITARARHLTKMLDNKNKFYADILSEFAAELAEHRNALTGKAVRLARWLETDLGLYFVDGALVGATVPIAYRLGLNPAQPASMWGADLNSITEEWGATLAVLGAATLDPSEPQTTLNLTGIRVTHRDRRADRFLAGRFEPQFPLELKLLILMVEGDLNTARLILPRTARGHQNAEFRARTVTCYHCLSALKRICDQYPNLDTKGLAGLRAVLAGAPAQRLLSPTGEKIRNRSVHYEMNDPAIIPDLARPMSGLVEAICSEWSWESFDRDVREATERSDMQNSSLSGSHKMDTDFTPGYPIDLRSPERRIRAAQGPVGDFEGMAARVVARLTGERVVIQDDGSRPAMPDIRIDYAAKPAAYVEAVVDIDTSYAAMDAAIFKGVQTIPSDRIWWARLSGRSNVNEVRRRLPTLLETGLSDEKLAQQLASMGIESIDGPAIPRPGQTGGIHLVPAGDTGAATPAWASFLDWIATFLAASKTADVRRKLAATNAPERHVFIAASFTTNGDAFFALDEEGRPELLLSGLLVPVDAAQPYRLRLPISGFGRPPVSDAA
jgi:hypothetical protein